VLAERGGMAASRPLAVRKHKSAEAVRGYLRGRFGSCFVCFVKVVVCTRNNLVVPDRDNR
jgi:hypothetical protein